MKHTRIPAGITDQNTEIFISEGVIQFIKNGQVNPFEKMDVADLAVIREAMENKPGVIEALEAMNITDPVQQIEQYIRCNFADFDANADISADGITIHEYFDCGKRGACQHEGKLCSLPCGLFGQLTPREIQIAKLVASDLADKQIADQLNIAYATVCTHRVNIEQKIGCHSKAGITAFAFQNNLL